ncbi:hypothetical protein EBB07_21570 [Paenibacillaceae bacterium]|nr:hypothetical protein EBB07_21570 [Paenibacillaceae bacterium]
MINPLKSRWKKTAALSLTAMLLAAPIYAHAANAAAAIGDNTAYARTSAEHKRNPHGMKHARRIAFHEEVYMKLLVEKYAPETLAEWETMLAARTKLRLELRSKLDALPEVKRHEWMASMKKARESEEWNNRHEVFKQFDQAVRSNDSAAIKVALSGVFDTYKWKNERLRQHLNQFNASE